jgi:hypothetical protein
MHADEAAKDRAGTRDKVCGSARGDGVEAVELQKLPSNVTP